MTDLKHTPGPWMVADNRLGQHITICQRSDGGAIYGAVCEIDYYGDEPADVNMHRTDASMIAGAPDMLEALQFIVSQVTDPANASHTLGAWCHGAGLQMAKEAIAKATTIKE